MQFEEVAFVILLAVVIKFRHDFVPLLLKRLDQCKRKLFSCNTDLEISSGS